MSAMLALLAALLLTALAVVVGGDCERDGYQGSWDIFSQPLEATPTPESEPRVTGTVTYREKIALSPDAKLIVSLEDVSLQDAPPVNIAGSVTNNPGQVPIHFEIHYSPDLIRERRTYAVHAKIEDRGEPAFINDTAYHVITNGQPAHVDMVLIKVDGSPSPPSLRANIQSVEVERSDFGYSLNVSFTLPNHCSRFYAYRVGTLGRSIEVSLEISDVSAGGNIGCAQAIQELSQRIAIEEDLIPGESYTVSVDGVLTNLFTVHEDLGVDVGTAKSPVGSVELLTLGPYPPQYTLHIISALPKGGVCSWFNGYDIASLRPDRIDVDITHHEVKNPQICTADYPTVETFVSLGSDFELGREYEVVVNGELVETFKAQ